MKLILYRGIAVPSDQASGVIVDIERRGLHGDIGTWGFRVPDISIVRREIDNLFARPDLDSAAIADDLAVRNELEARGVKVLEYTYGDVMEHFDEVAAQLELVLDPDPGASSVDLETLPGFAVVASDDASRSATVRVDATSWTASEAARLESLRSANLARLGGWSLRRVTD